VAVPSSVTIAAGSTSASFTATALAVSAAQTATITASLAGISTTFNLQLAAAVASLNINATTINFGSVTLNSPATQSITLTSTGALPVTVSSVLVVGSGFTIVGGALPVSLNSGQSATVNVQFDPTVAGAQTGTLTIVSTAAANPTVILSLAGTGVVSGPHEVDLSWVAPTSSADPVAGYGVYRSPTGAGTYQELNSLSSSQTTYVDTAVVSGQTYDYIVRSVDASGATSVPSNVVTLVIP
jgi:hypothetical protein